MPAINVRLPVVVLLVAPWVLAAPASGSSPPAPSVIISPPLCKSDSFPLIPFLDSLRVELAASKLNCCTLTDPSDGPPAVGSLQVRFEVVPCVSDPDRVQVWAQASADARVAEREISLADVVPSARPRALALVVAELIRSLERRPREAPPEAIAAPVQASISTPPSAGGALARALAVVVEGEARVYPTRDTLMWGGRVRFTSSRRSFHADLDCGADFARAGSDLGDVLLRSTTVGLGVGPRLETSVAIIDVGLHAELGWAWIRGEPRAADVRTGTGSDLISSLGLRVSLAVPARLRLRPSLTLESGAVLRGVKGQANGRPVAGMTGYYLLAGLGVGGTP
ncbi:MAG TPA: hypothetical protein VF524_01565 [Polyangia bacterium]